MVDDTKNLGMYGSDTSLTRIQEDPMEARTETRTASLIVVSGKEIGREYKLNQDRMILGRSLQAEVQIYDGKVSRKHSQIIIEENNLFTLVDLRSTNGTFINNDRISEKELTDGDKIQVGDTVLKFLIQDKLDEEYHDKLYHLATTDSLTNLFLKRYFYQELDREILRAKRYKRTIGLMMLDIDHFKQVNDTYGHQTGDQVLKSISFLIKDLIRREDTAARYGGEEIVLILPEANPSFLGEIAERLRSGIASHEYHVFNDENRIFNLTISIGVTCYSETNEVESHDLVRQADEALYEAKEAGRNRVATFTI